MFSGCSKCTSVVQEIDSGWGRLAYLGVFGNFLYVLLNFAVNVGLLQKVKSIFKKST